MKYPDTCDRMTQDNLLDRRHFLVSVSLADGGLALGIVSSNSQRSWSADERVGDALSAWMEISKDDAVTMRVPTPEIDNGAMTQVAKSIDEELGCNWDGAIVESNFNKYRMLRINDRLPVINVHFDALSNHDRFDIASEAPAAPSGPTIGNAISKLRQTPA